MSKVGRRALVVTVVVAALAGGCLAPASGTPTPPPSLAPTPPPPAITAAPSRAAAAEIDNLIASMAAAVLAHDRAAYLALVDLSEASFALEHARWADDWSGANPVSQYTLQLSDVVVHDLAATGRLTVTWMLPGGEGPRSATYEVRFTGGPGAWRYAGEAWIVTQVEHFRIQVAPGLEAAAPNIAAGLPDIYERVTTALGYEPVAPLEIKLYADAPALVANTLLSLPDIRGWNEPGEALKLRFDPGEASLAPVIAHEFTHFIGFDRAGTHRTRMPWWLDEGIASYVAASFEGPSGDDRLAQVVAWEASGELAAWTSMAVFEDTPVAQWRFVYPQGYAMTRYVTETYGEAKRNAWLAAMTIEMDIDQATPAKLGLSFDELDTGFRKWLVGMRPD